MKIHTDSQDPQKSFNIPNNPLKRYRPKTWHAPTRRWPKERGYVDDEETALARAQSHDTNYWNFVAQEIITFNQYVRGY